MSNSQEFQLCVKRDDTTEIISKLEENPKLSYNNVALITATKNGNVAVIAKFIELNANLNIEDEDGDSLLIIAIRNKNYELVKLMLNTKAVKIISCYKSDIELESYFLKISKNNDYISNVTDKEMNLILNIQEEKSYLGLLKRAIKIKNTRFALLLIKYNIGIDYRSKKQETILLLACKYENTSVVLALIAKGMDVTTSCINNRTPLHLICLNNMKECIGPVLENGANINARTIVLNTPLMLAVQENNVECAKLLLQYGAISWHANIYNKNAVLIAADLGFIECIKLFTDEYEFTQKDSDKNSALHLACTGNHKNIVKFLLEKKIDKNEVNKSGETPYTSALKLKYTEICNLLI